MLDNSKPTNPKDQLRFSIGDVVVLKQEVALHRNKTFNRPFVINEVKYPLVHGCSLNGVNHPSYIWEHMKHLELVV
jgi:hypothetical protein